MNLCQCYTLFFSKVDTLFQSIPFVLLIRYIPEIKQYTKIKENYYKCVQCRKIILINYFKETFSNNIVISFTVFNSTNRDRSSSYYCQKMEDTMNKIKSTVLEHFKCSQQSEKLVKIIQLYKCDSTYDEEDEEEEEEEEELKFILDRTSNC